MAAISAEEFLRRLEDEQDAGPYLCMHNDCDRDFASVAGLRGHLRAVHDDRVNGALPENGGRPLTFKCPDCGEAFAKNQGLGSHRARLHGYRSTNSHANKPNGAKAQGRITAAKPQESQIPGNPGIQEHRIIARFYVPVDVIGLGEFAAAQGSRPQVRPCEDGSFELVVEADA